MKVTHFRDRVHAGQLLAGELMQYADREDVIVLGLPRGGVPVACEVAKKLHAPVDVLVVRKLGMPGWEELAMGAIASGGVRVLNQDVVRSAGITQAAIEAAVTRESRELQRRELAYRGHTGVPEIEDKTVILVDDGIATGSTVKAAVQALRQQEPARIIIAVPTAAPDACAMLEPMVDELVVLLQPDEFRAVGQWYEDFSQTTDAEVTQWLAKAALASQPK
ncbi:MAG: phosphoribosyltransferase [Verrucomicrobiota bacterium]